MSLYIVKMKLYPLKFNPVYSSRIWGGTKLKEVLKKEYNQEGVGESWEVSDVKYNETLVSSGDLQGKSLKDLIRQFKGDFVGNSVYNRFGNDFPLLIKFIDAKTPLSIQVHPSNKLAKERHNSFGKNEMWYVMQAEPDAELIVGFNQTIEKEDYIKHLNDRTLNEILNIEKASSGDIFYIPTGRIHAIGAGVLLAEIQQTSNITYRIYDYDRVDVKTGVKRELHTDLAIDALDYNHYSHYRINHDSKANVSNKLVYSPYFKTNIIYISDNMDIDYSNTDSFVIYMCVEGGLELECDGNLYSLQMGETIVIPAIINEIKLKATKAKLLEVYL